MPPIIYLFVLLLYLGSLSNAERIYAQKVNELPGDLQDFIQISKATGNIILSLEANSNDVVHIPLISLKASNQLEFRISRVDCCTKKLHTQKWSFIYTAEDKCCLDVAWTSGREKMIGVGLPVGYQYSYANAYADKSAVIQINGSNVNVIGKDDDQGNATIVCELDAEKSKTEGDVSYNMPFSVWNVPHSHRGDCNIQLEFDGSIYKLEAQWPSRAAIKNILIGSGMGLIVLTAVMSLTCALMELCDKEKDEESGLSYSRDMNSVIMTSGDTRSLKSAHHSTEQGRKLRSTGKK